MSFWLFSSFANVGVAGGLADTISPTIARAFNCVGSFHMWLLFWLDCNECVWEAFIYVALCMQG